MDCQESNEIYSEFLKAQNITGCESPTEPLEAESKLLWQNPRVMLYGT